MKLSTNKKLNFYLNILLFVVCIIGFCYTSYRIIQNQNIISTEKKFSNFIFVIIFGRSAYLSFKQIWNYNKQ